MGERSGGRWSHSNPQWGINPLEACAENYSHLIIANGGMDDKFQKLYIREAYALVRAAFTDAVEIGRIKDGKFRVTVSTGNVDNYLKVTDISNTKVKIYLDPIFNQWKGIVSHPDLLEYKLEDIHSVLETDYSVLNAERIRSYKNKREGEDTNMVILTFERSTLPGEVRLDHLP